MTFRTRYDLASGGPGIIFILLVILTVMLKPPFLYSMAILATGVIAGWLQSVQALTCPYCRNIAVAKDEEGEVPLPLVGAVPAQCCQCGASPDGIGG